MDEGSSLVGERERWRHVEGTTSISVHLCVGVLRWTPSVRRKCTEEGVHTGCAREVTEEKLNS